MAELHHSNRLSQVGKTIQSAPSGGSKTLPGFFTLLTSHLSAGKFQFALAGYDLVVPLDVDICVVSVLQLQKL